MTTSGGSARLVHRVLASPGARSAGFALLLVGPVVLRLHSSSELWLDEALSVNIARLPLPELLAALRQDGSPPLYYVLLHGWIAVFGVGNDAVRSLSTAVSLLALAVALPLGRRLGGAAGGPTAVLLLAACPFAIRYATETRMYALVLLLVLLGLLAVLRAQDRPTPVRLGLVALVAAALALTHYWTLFLLLTAEVVLVVLVVRGYRRRATGRVAVALPAGGVLFLPWVPTFLFQLAHTGTPWAGSPSLAAVPVTVERWSGPGWSGVPLTVVLVAMVVVGLRRGLGRSLLALSVGTLVIGVMTSQLQGSGFSLRYSAPAVVPFLLAATVGAVRLPAWLRAVVLTYAVVATLIVAGASSLLAPRTQAGSTAAALQAGLLPTDLVIYCPDQLGPSVDRLLPPGVDQVVYPTMGPPQRIDWVDYAQRNAAADPAAFAAAASARTSGALWLVSADGYRTYGTQCADLATHLAALRGAPVLQQEEAAGTEGQRLQRFPAR